MAEDSSCGLRSRKKQRTRAAIERAALELALERHNPDATVEEICERAGISRMTFFNYFPSKIAALTGESSAGFTIDDLVSLLEAHPERFYLDALVEFGQHVIIVGTDEEIASLRRRAMEALPELGFQERRLAGALKQAVWEAFNRFLSEHPERRVMPEAPVEDEASMAAHLAVALFKISLSRYVRTSNLPEISELRASVASFLAAPSAVSHDADGQDA